MVLKFPAAGCAMCSNSSLTRECRVVCACTPLYCQLCDVHSHRPARMRCRYARHIKLPPGIALNAALKENLFAIAVTMQCNIPLIINGPPGSSKTLSFRIAAAELRGVTSSNPFFRYGKVLQQLCARVGLTGAALSRCVCGYCGPGQVVPVYQPGCVPLPVQQVINV